MIDPDDHFPGYLTEPPGTEFTAGNSVAAQIAREQLTNKTYQATRRVSGRQLTKLFGKGSYDRRYNRLSFLFGIPGLIVQPWDSPCESGPRPCGRLVIWCA